MTKLALSGKNVSFGGQNMSEHIEGQPTAAVVNEPCESCNLPLGVAAGRQLCSTRLNTLEDDNTALCE